MSKQVDNMRALTIEGLTVTVAGMVRDELRLCCAVPRAFMRGAVSSVVMTMGAECYRAGQLCAGKRTRTCERARRRVECYRVGQLCAEYDAGCRVAQFAVVTAEAAPLGFFFGLNR